MQDDVERSLSGICKEPYVTYLCQAELQEEENYVVGVSGKSGEPSVPASHGTDLPTTRKLTRRTYLAEESLLSCIGGCHLQEMIN